jgi:hypothetical protein
VPGLAVLLVGQLVYFGYGHAAQTEPELYFPKVAILDRIANETNGRIIGFNCLPANLAQAAGVRDVRGYDGIDPSRMVQLILAARNPKTHGPAYARTQTISPLMFSDSATGVPRVPPILDMLSVRYIVFRGAPPTGVQPAYADEDYWVLSNERALPRAYVPRHTDVISDDRLRLEALSSRSFNPLETAYLEHAVDLPSNIDGSVEFVEDTPQRITLSATMQTSGLVILADRWDPGWKAYVNDIAVPIWRVNHALRGVRVESGASELRFVYEPASLYKGLTISAAGSLAWFAWAGTVVVLRLRRKEFLPAAVVTAANSSEQPAPIINIGRRKENRRKTKRIRRSV